MQEKFVKTNNQWSYLGVPNKLNGFGVIFLGDSIGSVSENSTDWHENSKKRALFSFLLKHGYVIGYSNARGQNWGNDQALEDIVELYKLMMKETKVHPSIHLFAISMGGILALRLMKEGVIPIRSVAFSQPILNIQGQREYENKLIQDNKLDVENDPIGKAFAKAHNIPLEKIDTYIDELGLLQSPLPDYNCKIWYGTGDPKVPVDKNTLHYTKLRNEQGLQTYLDIRSCAGHDKEEVCYSDHHGIVEFYKEYE